MRARSTCILFCLDKSDLFSCLDDFPDVRKRMVQCAEVRRKRLRIIDPATCDAAEPLTGNDLFDQEDAAAEALRITVGVSAAAGRLKNV